MKFINIRFGGTVLALIATPRARGRYQARIKVLSAYSAGLIFAALITREK